MVPVVRFIPSIQSCNTIDYLLGSTYGVSIRQVAGPCLSYQWRNAQCRKHTRFKSKTSLSLFYCITRTSICVTYSTLMSVLRMCSTLNMRLIISFRPQIDIDWQHHPPDGQSFDDLLSFPLTTFHTQQRPLPFRFYLKLTPRIIQVCFPLHLIPLCYNGLPCPLRLHTTQQSISIVMLVPEMSWSIKTEGVSWMIGTILSRCLVVGIDMRTEL